MKKLLFSITLLGFSTVYAQTELVFVFFKDKPNKATFYANPLSELTQKSLDRRTNQGIALNDQDAPIEASYIQNIKNLGFTVTDSSKWLNGVAVNATATQIIQLENLPFVQNVESFVKNPDGGKTAQPINKFEKFASEIKKTDFNYGASESQIEQIHLKTLHQNGFTGSGITIAMLDTGYPTVNTAFPFSRLRDAGKIKGGYNFVSKNSDIYNSGFNAHGTVCLGAIAGYIDNQFVGSAPDAEFYLYVTESGPLEIPEEELYWIQGAEDADRKGVDIISASLGYYEFDDTRYNYTYADMTGNTSFVARGARVAAEKGIIVMVANGNAGTSDWHYVLTPADNTEVFSVGAVTPDGSSSGFSSFGPNALGAIKPDASARGTQGATVLNNDIVYVNGTSIATPIAAGGVASLLQAIPNSTSRDVIKNQLRNTSSLAPSHSDQMGFGILNFGQAYTNFLATNEISGLHTVLLYPNPNKGQFTLQTESIGSFQIYDLSGKLLIKGKTLKGKNDISTQLKSGTYLLSLVSENGIKSSQKLIIQ